jgi:hypothetical protein
MGAMVRRARVPRHEGVRDDESVARRVRGMIAVRIRLYGAEERLLPVLPEVSEGLWLRFSTDLMPGEPAGRGDLHSPISHRRFFLSQIRSLTRARKPSRHSNSLRVRGRRVEDVRACARLAFPILATDETRIEHGSITQRATEGPDLDGSSGS